MELERHSRSPLDDVDARDLSRAVAHEQQREAARGFHDVLLFAAEAGWERQWVIPCLLLGLHFHVLARLRRGCG